MLDFVNSEDASRSIYLSLISEILLSAIWVFSLPRELATDVFSSCQGASGKLVFQKDGGIEARCRPPLALQEIPFEGNPLGAVG